ncbi:hypothetical protein EN792_074880 [Mesorhizobium sp. M00.F.Ca.ET.149.01.1.1]|nr:hypothetical protein EN792_074880 [Mesorhizobium sp. M00.F.Ca.ET.149.01.1.1]
MSADLLQERGYAAEMLHRVIASDPSAFDSNDDRHHPETCAAYCHEIIVGPGSKPLSVASHAA